MSLLGIDIGTTGCKAGVFSDCGQCLCTAYREYSTLYPQSGYAELDSINVWLQVKEAIQEAVSGAKEDPVSTLCVSSLGEAAVPVSAGRDILGSSILCSDIRGGEYIASLLERIGREPMYRINPNIPGPNYTLPKILWIKENQPDLYEKADTFLLWDGLTGFLLGCDPYISFSHANRTLLFDINLEDWSEDIIHASGMDREKLPPCVREGTVVGTVSKSAAEELGLSAGVKVVAGGHDQCLNALGAGITQPGHAVDGIGTFECITPIYDTIPDSSSMLENGLNIEHYVLPGMYVSFIYNQAGSLVRWFRDTFAQEIKDRDDVYDVLNAEMPEAPTDLFVLPYFEPSGSPGFVADASGVITGLKTSTSRGEILKAVMESITYYFAESLETLRQMNIDTSEFTATGGGARSDRWLQIKADIFGRPFVRPDITEAGLAGAAILAGVSAGVFSTPEEGTECFVQRGDVFEPDSGRHAEYRGRLQKYKELLPLMRDYLRRL